MHTSDACSTRVLKKDTNCPWDTERKWKGRVVFQGNNVLTQHYELAVFTEMANQAATMEASACADACGSPPGNTVMQADAEQAYTQA